MFTISKRYLQFQLSFVIALGFLLAMSFVPPTHAQATDPDTEAPTDVENVKATAGDSKITLNWDVATDNVAVVGYKIYYGTESVSSSADDYNLPVVNAGNAITYTLEGLKNDTDYYFAVTAYDEAGNESESYSTEVSAAPKGSATAAPTAGPDTTAPVVSKSEAVTKTMVQVMFSEAIVLPSEKPETAFSIKNNDSGEILQVTKVEMDEADADGMTVLLTTAEQVKDAEYILTAGIDIEDKAGNSIVSGTSDTAAFNGTDLEAPLKASADAEKPFIKGLNVLDARNVEVIFNEEIRLSVDPSDNFAVTQKDDTKKLLAIRDIRLSRDKNKVLLVTEPQEAVEYSVIAMDVTDAAGNLIDLTKNMMSFTGKVAEGTPDEEGEGGAEGEEGGEVDDPEEETPTDPADKIAPEDATELFASALETMIVRLTWVASLNSAEDLTEYMLYVSDDKGKTYNKGQSVGKALTQFDLRGLKGGMEYFFKLTAKDAAGNESDGVITSLKLPETGAGVGLLLLGSMGGAHLVGRRRRKRQ